MKKGEFEFIEALKGLGISHNLGRGEFGIGDDSAVLGYKDDRVYLATTDMLIEGIHFRHSDISMRDLGYKSVAVNLSDIAAMGGIGEYIMLSLGIPKGLSDEDVLSFYEGVSEIGSMYNLGLIGGDTNRSGHDFIINVTVIGSCRIDKVLYRSNAKVGDSIYVTGTLGDSGAGFLLLDKYKDIEIDVKTKTYLLNRHKRPSPRIFEMAYLNNVCPNIRSCIDISDGLANDLFHILTMSSSVSSSLGAILDKDKLPYSESLSIFCDARNVDKYSIILNAGEDYELVFTHENDISNDIINCFIKDFNVFLTKIGTVCEGGYYLQDKDKKTAIILRGHDHFK